MHRWTDGHAGFCGRIGAARTDITPPIGIYARNWGAAAHDAAEGIHRPLTATVLSIRSEEGGPPAVLASLDLGWWRRPDDERFLRAAVLERTGLDPARLIIALTHTHAGPAVCLADAARPGGHLIAPYLERVRNALADAAAAAMASEEPALLEWTAGRCGLARNRDLPDPSRDRLLCGYRPDAEADDTLLVGRVTARDGRPIATIVNYACHPTTLAWTNRLISPDYVGALRDVVEAASDGAPCLFLQGASGELAPRRQYVGDPSVADANGRELGHAAAAALAGMLPPGERLRFRGALESGAPLAVWELEPCLPGSALLCRRIEVEVPLQPWPSPAELKAQLAGAPDPAQRERLERKLRIRLALGEGSTARMPVWVWRLGDSALLGLPNEAYSYLQRTLRSRLAGAPVAVATVANGHTGYLPPSGLYDRDAYPVRQTPFARGSLERVTEACVAAAAEMLRDEPGGNPQ